MGVCVRVRVPYYTCQCWSRDKTDRMLLNQTGSAVEEDQEWQYNSTQTALSLSTGGAQKDGTLDDSGP